MERIAEDQGHLKHDRFLAWFNDLMIDATLLVLARPPRAPITLERLNEGTRLANELMACREPDRFF
jgi:hypothetical protein